MVLQEDDRLYIRQIPEWQLHPSVSLTGEVNFPGEYVLTRRDETLKDLIDRAGGFTPEAFPKGTVFLRPSLANALEKMNLRKQLDRSSPLYMDSMGQIQQLSFMEFEASSVGRISLDVERMIASQGEEANIVLEHGDQIVVPPVPGGVSVIGAVGLNGTIQYREGKKVQDYIDWAGGFTRRADKDQTRLIKASGQARSGGGTLGQRVDLGDVVAVPSKIERPGNFARDLVLVLTVVTASITTIIVVARI
jgi:polysaccharide export outer membrane protein